MEESTIKEWYLDVTSHFGRSKVIVVLSVGVEIIEEGLKETVNEVVFIGKLVELVLQETCVATFPVLTVGRHAHPFLFLQELKEVYSGVEISYPEIMRPVVPSLLKSLKEQGLKIALASSSRMDNILEVLTSCKIREFFDFVVSGEQFVHSKPDPEIYFHVMKALEVQPEECLIIEDSTYGVTAAHRAGAHVIAVRDDRFCFNQSLADYQINSLEEVLQYI